MSQTEYTDTRSNLTHPIEEGQVYEDDRTGIELVVVYESEHVVLARDDSNEHRLESRTMFERNVGSDRYALDGTRDVDTSSSTTQRKSDSNEVVDLESIDGIGAKAASNLRANGYSTKSDVRSADKESLVSVDLMGDTTAERLLDHVS